MPFLMTFGDFPAKLGVGELELSVKTTPLGIDRVKVLCLDTAHGSGNRTFLQEFRDRVHILAVLLCSTADGSRLL